MPAFIESVVEEAALAWLESIGWQLAHGPDIAPDMPAPERTDYAEFVYLAATAAENIDALAHLADGGAYPAVRPELVAATRIACPGDKVLERFSLDAHPLLTKIAHNERESRTLAALRDALLPKLIAGELRVKDAERFAAGLA
jgi:type I restriction enzyme S subunit